MEVKGKPDGAGGPSITILYYKWKPVYAGGHVGCNGKPDVAGGPLSGSTFAWKLVYAGGLALCTREARQSGTPGDNYSTIYIYM